MKTIITTLLLVAATSVSVMAQNYMTKTGTITFYSEAALENIEATTNQVTSILDPASGQMVFQLKMKSFQFEKALMQEHFNESYVESDKYPNAQFDGKITNIDAIDLTKDGEFDVQVKGNLTIHGETNVVETGGTVKVKDGKITAESKFPLVLADYGIDIPGGKKKNIAEQLSLTVKMIYTKK